MTPALRLLDTGLAAARWNVAMTAALAELHAAAAASPTPCACTATAAACSSAAASP